LFNLTPARHKGFKEIAPRMLPLNTNNYSVPLAANFRASPKKDPQAAAEGDQAIAAGDLKPANY
jgi:hypothetical protein